MTISETHTQVLIVGAGPSGLMMAAQLLRYGVQPVIIDCKQGPTDESKALAVQARSLEIYRQMGIADRVLPNGKPAAGAWFSIYGRPATSISLADAGKDQTPFPYLLLYPQNKNERLLLDVLTHNCCPVYWETSLLSFKQLNGQVAVQLQHKDQVSVLTCDYLVGADGAHSPVRKQLGIPFNGDTYNRSFYLADVDLANEQLEGDMVKVFLNREGFTGFFPLPEPKRFRVIGNLPKELDGREGLNLEHLLPYLNSNAQQQINITNKHWLTTYRLHHRMADKFRDQRCFLVGDAAHIHSPVGGQGMNTGLQDAYNLAWKLAGVVNGQLREQVLDSYAAERMPVAKELLATTDRAFSLIMSQNFFIRLLKKWLLPFILQWAWRKPYMRERFFKSISQTGISYRDSNLNLNVSQATKVKAGDRLPYLKVFDEKKQQETDLHEWCSKPGFTLIVLGKLSELDLFTLAKWITQHYPNLLNFFYLPISAKNQHVFEAFETGKNQAKSIIIRPDMYIGFCNDKVDMVLMDNYLKNVVGVVV
jgi:2-polyprenyl-6-methoxyphenol hydroxylase-like FAD-dependent oxidoreductase